VRLKRFPSGHSRAVFYQEKAKGDYQARVQSDQMVLVIVRQDCLLCLLQSPLYSIWSSVPFVVPSSALCPLYGPVSLLWPSVPATALCLHFALCFLCGLLSPLRSSVPSTSLCPPLYCPLSPVQPSIHFTYFCLSDVSVPPPQPSLPFTAPRPL
jgi:hypothetical protein